MPIRARTFAGPIVVPTTPDLPVLVITVPGGRHWLVHSMYAVNAVNQTGLIAVCIGAFDDDHLVWKSEVLANGTARAPGTFTLEQGDTLYAQAEVTTRMVLWVTGTDYPA